jgi:hypothetical protein
LVFQRGLNEVSICEIFLCGIEKIFAKIEIKKGRLVEAFWLKFETIPIEKSVKIPWKRRAESFSKKDSQIRVKTPDFWPKSAEFPRIFVGILVLSCLLTI